MLLQFIKRFLFIICVCRCTCDLYAQKILAKPVEYSWKNDSTINQYERLIKYYRYYKADSALYLCKEALHEARVHGDSNGVARIYLQSGMINDNSGDFETSRQLYETALKIFQNLNQQSGVASTDIRLGVVSLRNGNYDKAIEEFYKALRISEQLSDLYGQMEAQYSISWAFLDQKKYTSALQYLKIADSLNQMIPFSSLSLNILNNYGSIYRNLQEYKKAEKYLLKGIAYSRDKENQGLNITMIRNLSAVYAKEGYADKAIELLKEALNRSRMIGNFLRELQCLSGLGESYSAKDPEKAISYFQQAIQLAKEKRLYTQEIRYLTLVIPLYVAKKDYKNAYLKKNREYTLADSFYYKKLSQNIASLKAEYELHKSQARIKELDFLNEKHQMQLKNSAQIRNITWSGIALLLILLGLLYYHYREKQNANQKITVTNQKLERLLNEKQWLIKEVHHRVKNNLQIIISLFNTQSQFLTDPSAIQAINDGKERLQTISLIHQKLCQPDHGSSIDIASYFPEMVSNLKTGMANASFIHFQLNIDEITMDISQVVPLGLILNEAITNSIKHAFPNQKHGTISILLKQMEHDNIFMQIEDNGIGVQPGFDSLNSNSLGMQLINLFAEQLEADLDIQSAQGFSITLVFKKYTHSNEQALAFN